MQNTPHRLKTRGAGKAAVPWVFASELARTHIRLQQSEAHRYRERYRTVINSAVEKIKGSTILHELFHDPALATRGVVFSAVDIFFTLANVPLPLSDFEFAVKEFFSAWTNPAWRRQ